MVDETCERDALLATSLPFVNGERKLARAILFVAVTCA